MPNMSQEEFWGAVIDEREKIAVALQKGVTDKGVPVGKKQHKYNENLKLKFRGGKFVDNNPVYCTSLQNRDRGTTEGSVVLMTIQMAGQRFVEQTHRLSTDEEIQTYLENGAKERQEIIRADRKRRMSYVQEVGPRLDELAADDDNDTD